MAFDLEVPQYLIKYDANIMTNAITGKVQRRLATIEKSQAQNILEPVPTVVVKVSETVGCSSYGATPIQTLTPSVLIQCDLCQEFFDKSSPSVNTSFDLQSDPQKERRVQICPDCCKLSRRVQRLETQMTELISTNQGLVEELRTTKELFMLQKSNNSVIP